eukprot:3342172-Pleurochrysis_carterae.AAC.1
MLASLSQELYCAEVGTWVGCQPLRSAIDKKTGSPSGRAPGSWYSARTEALRQYSLKHFGVKDLAAGDVSTSLIAQPKSLFKLKARPDHSNYPECDLCRESRLEVERLIYDAAPRAQINEKRAELMGHVHAMMAERNICYELASEALRPNELIFCLDDKLGSHWQFLPIPPDGRDGKKTAGKWKYRQCLQGNSFPGVGNFLSVVPPML